MSDSPEMSPQHRIPWRSSASHSRDVDASAVTPRCIPRDHRRRRRLAVLLIGELGQPGSGPFSRAPSTDARANCSGRQSGGRRSHLSALHGVAGTSEDTRPADPETSCHADRLPGRRPVSSVPAHTRVPERQRRRLRTHRIPQPPWCGGAGMTGYSPSAGGEQLRRQFGSAPIQPDVLSVMAALGGNGDMPPVPRAPSEV